MSEPTLAAAARRLADAAMMILCVADDPPGRLRKRDLPYYGELEEALEEYEMACLPPLTDAQKAVERELLLALDSIGSAPLESGGGECRS